MKKLIIILAAAILCSAAAVKIGPILIQRATWDMLEQVRLAPGELVYVVNPDNTVTLRLGDGEATYGLQPVDPAAIRVAAKRPLDRSEYYVETFGGAVARIDGSYYWDSAAVTATGGIRVVTQNAAATLASVSYGQQTGWSGDQHVPQRIHLTRNIVDGGFVTLATNALTISAIGENTTFAVVSNISVSVWTDRQPIGSVWDTSQTTLLTATATNAASPTTLGQMSAWLANNEGRHWSLYAAAADVFVGGYRLVLDSAKRWTLGHDAGSDNLLLLRGGGFVARTYGSSAGSTNGWCRIHAVSFTTNVMSLYVATSSAPAVAPTASFSPDLNLWSLAPALAQSYTNTVTIDGLACYRIDVAASESSGFYRADAEFDDTTPPGVEVRSLMVDGKRIVLNPDGTVTWE